MFDILFIPVVIVVIFCFQYWLYGKYMFVVFSDKSYILFNIAFKSYRLEVIHNKKLYDRYVDDFCVKHTRQTPDHLNKYGVVESSKEKNCIKNRVQKLLETRPDLVQKYFQERAFNYKDYKQMVEEFDTTVPLQILVEFPPKEADILTSKFDDVKHIIKDEILKYENKIDNPKHKGQRIFGYILKEGYINASKNNEQRLDAWREFTGLEDNTPEFHYLRNPSTNKNSSKIINKQLKEIDEFFRSIKLRVDVYYDKKR
jgi:hypothetical protein